MVYKCALMLPVGLGKGQKLGEDILGRGRVTGGESSSELVMCSVAKKYKHLSAHPKTLLFLKGALLDPLSESREQSSFSEEQPNDSGEQSSFFG